MKQLIIYIHGKGDNGEEAKHYRGNICAMFVNIREV